MCLTGNFCRHFIKLVWCILKQLFPFVLVAIGGYLPPLQEMIVDYSLMGDVTKIGV